MKIKGFKDTIEWYNQNAEKYAKATSALASLDEINRFAKLLPPNALVVDAGCGSDKDTFLLSEKKLRATGLDLSQELIKIARRTYPKLKFIDGNMLKMLFSDAEYENTMVYGHTHHCFILNPLVKL